MTQIGASTLAHVPLKYPVKDNIFTIYTVYCLKVLYNIEHIYYLVKFGCSRWSKTMMMSPGSIPGSWSPSPWKTIFWPSLIPAAGEWTGDSWKSLVFWFSLHRVTHELYKLSSHSHLCQCGPPKSSSAAGSFCPHILCSDPCGWFSVLGPDSCGTLWTLAVPYLVPAGACGPACLCHGRSCTSVQLLSDSHDLPRAINGQQSTNKDRSYFCFTFGLLYKQHRLDNIYKTD